ncbi:MAG: Uma2 family endonuclease [Candidatus Competibacteraceae bacterium]|nr:Uma2 family endonuclease [Candidatus Competibacteraceae bacterium]MCB1820450.1 Uma2 family endonuclease [Candidatus Competibacteraceae bacterium]
MNAVIKPQYSDDVDVAEFIEWENQQDTRHELLDGEIIAMTGGTVAHASLILQIGAALLHHLKGTPCRVFTSDLKVQALKNVFYPDVVVSCESQENDGVLCHCPKLIIEVLSSSTSRKDRSKKRLAYQEIESLEEYVLVSQEAKHIEVYRREDDWQASIHIGGVVELRSVNFSLAIDEIYADLD